MFDRKKYEPIRESLAEHERRLNRVLVVMNTVLALLELYYIIRSFVIGTYTPADGMYYYQVYVMIVNCALFTALTVLILLMKNRHPRLPRILYAVIALFKAASYSVFMESSALSLYFVPVVFAVGYFDVIYSTAVSASTMVVYVIAELVKTKYGIVDLSYAWITDIDGLNFVYDVPTYIHTRILYGILPTAILLLITCLIAVVLTKIGAETFLRENQMSEEKAALDAELSLGRTIQQSMLPDRIVHTEHYTALSYMVSAKEVGGDFIDYYPLDDRRVLFTIGDVSGKGIAASLFASNAKALIRAFAMSGADPAAVMTQVNASLCAANKYNMFVTAWLGILDLKTGEVSFSNGGHNPPICKTADGTARYIDTLPNFIMGVREPIDYQLQSITLSPGDSLILYTDGVTEARDEKGGFYGDGRLLEFANAAPVDDSFTRALRQSVFDFKGAAEQSDDLSIACLTYHRALQ